MSQEEDVRNYMGFGLVFGDLGKVQGMGPLLWFRLLAGSSDNSMTRQLNYYLEHKKNEMRLTLTGKEVTVILDRIGGGC